MVIKVRLAHQGLPSRRRQAVHRPGVAPGGPAPQPLRIAEGVAEPQAGNSEQLGEAANHHQIGVIGQQRHQRLRLTARHQRQKSLIADHQREALEQCLQAGPAPELPSGVMGIGDPHGLG